MIDVYWIFTNTINSGMGILNGHKKIKWKSNTPLKILLLQKAKYLFLEHNLSTLSHTRKIVQHNTYSRHINNICCIAFISCRGISIRERPAVTYFSKNDINERKYNYNKIYNYKHPIVYAWIHSLHHTSKQVNPTMQTSQTF